MIQIFLAHASEDKAAVIDLYNRLKAAGFKPWLDVVDLLPGQSWRAEIPKAIRNSHVFIACLSKQSVAKHGYIQREFKMALQKMADKPPGQIYLIPVRLDDGQVPELRQEEYGISLNDFQWVDLFAPEGFDRLVRSIKHSFPDMSSQSEASKPSLEGRGFEDNTVSSKKKPTQYYRDRSEEKSKSIDKPTLSTIERLRLIQAVNDLPSPQFDVLVFALNPPRGNMPGDAATQANRGTALLSWAESSLGPGLHEVQMILKTILA